MNNQEKALIHDTIQPSPLRVIVIGASAGGLNALPEVVAHFQAGLNAAVFIVLHLSRTSLGDFLLLKLQPHTTFQCKIAEDGEPVRSGVIYLAPPDRHLLMREGQVVIGHGPVENRWRPSIDVLFRAAAAAYAERCIGIILTGLLDDGAAGMLAIQQCGGICLVQDPNEAEFPNMPLAVLERIEVDESLPLAEIGPAVVAILEQPAPPKADIAPELLAEADIAARTAIGVDEVMPLGEHAIFSCPDCGGGLWEIKEDGLSRYRCYVGHAYTEKDLLLKQHEALESTLWVALRMMEDRRNLVAKMAAGYRKRGLVRLATGYEETVRDVGVHIGRLKEVLFATQAPTAAKAPEIPGPQEQPGVDN